MTWSPPTTYEDGRPMEEPLKYKVYYGNRFKRYPNRYPKWKNAGDQTRQIIDGLEPGKTYYFVVTAYTEENGKIKSESKYSEALAVRIVEP